MNLTHLTRRLPHVTRSLQVVLLTALVGLAAKAQTPAAAPEPADCSRGLLMRSLHGTHYRPLRELADPGTHQRWLLLQDPNNPGPALLVEDLQPSGCTFSKPAGAGSGIAALAGVAGSAELAGSPGFARGAGSRPVVVIHGGDRIILSDHTRIADAELEATALGQAAAGEPVSVRIRSASLPLRAIATRAGHATLGGQQGERRP